MKRTVVSATVYPHHVVIPALVFPATIVQGTWTGLGVSGAAFFGHYRDSGSSAIDDEARWNVPLVAGTWRLDVFYLGAPSGGIWQVSIDAAAAGDPIDTYNAGVPPLVATREGIVLTTSGPKTITFKTTSKHASSSAYQLLLSGFSLTRTA